MNKFMKNTRAAYLSEIESYYSSKLIQHGETALGVDWNSAESQMLRFKQLCKVIKKSKSFSVNDLGCGYGAFYTYLSNKRKSFTYFGMDISHDMIQTARRRFQDKSETHFVVSDKPDQIADYGIASGIFNVRFDRSDDEWLSSMVDTLDELHQTSRLGFAFNCLTSYSDAEKMRKDLFYADPCFFFNLCMRSYAKNVALLHNYGLYEFTILVTK
jgi:SAM-dependent methyltransferase